MTNASNRREQSRREVQWDAECRLGGIFAEGLLRDISRSGAFFMPGATFVGDTAGLDSSDLSFLERGDTILLRYLPQHDAEPVTVLATVRWTGHSDEHKAVGAGLEFDTLE